MCELARECVVGGVERVAADRRQARPKGDYPPAPPRECCRGSDLWFIRRPPLLPAGQSQGGRPAD